MLLDVATSFEVLRVRLQVVHCQGNLRQVKAAIIRRTDTAVD